MLAILVRWLTHPLRGGRDDGRPADAIVVLGAPVGRDGRVRTALAERVAAGVEAARRGRAPVVVLTGGATRHGHVEALAMRRHALTLGFEEERLLVEPEARSTAENAARVAALLAARGLGREVL